MTRPKVNNRRGIRKVRLGVVAVLLIILAIAGVMAAPRSASPYYKLAIFARVLTHVERLYVDTVDEESIIFGAIRGMIRALDPHSAFLTPEEFAILEADTLGRFGGVGLEVGIRDDVLTVISPFPNTPAERAGLEPGDQIVAIEGQLTRSMTIDDAVRLMRGKPGTEVTITVRRSTKDVPFDVVLTREVIRVKSVEAELIAPGFPWIRVATFQDGTTADVDEAITNLSRESGELRGILLDLRRNPGGTLEEAVRLSDLFIEEGAIVTTRGRGGQIIQELSAHRRGTIPDVPMVVLIDGASASASEIVAGALQDHGRALVVGLRSFGKGSVQSVIDLGQGYGLKLTVARYFTPLGRSIQVEGVKPDVIIESRKAPEPDPDTATISAMPGEGDLPGHLRPEGAGLGDDDLLAIDDYQLRIAFQLLVGIVRLRERAALTK